MHRIPTSKEVLRWMGSGAELVQDTHLGTWVLHELGRSSLVGDVWEVPKKIALLLVEQKKIELVGPRVGGNLWRLADPHATSNVSGEEDERWNP